MTTSASPTNNAGPSSSGRPFAAALFAALVGISGCGDGFQLQNRWTTTHMYMEFLPRNQIVVASRAEGTSRGIYQLDETTDPITLVYSVYRESGDNVWAKCELLPLGGKFLQVDMKELLVNGEPARLPRKPKLLLERSDTNALNSPATATEIAAPSENTNNGPADSATTRSLR
jgi:hypothetical protein